MNIRLLLVYKNIEFKHFIFFIDIQFHKALLHLQYISFWHSNAFIINKITFGLLYNCRRKLQVEHNDLVIWWNFQNKIKKEIKRYEQKIKKKHIKDFVEDYTLYVNEFLSPVRLRMVCGANIPKFLIAVVNDTIKVCSYYKCYNVKDKCVAKSIKMKICKGCKLQYYCSRKCQKHDWNVRHRYECTILNINS